jgi:hypothetical protein
MAVPAATVAADFNEALDVHLDLAPEFTFYFILLVNNLAEAIDLIFSKLIHLGIRIYVELAQNLAAQVRANAVNILQGYPGMLVSRYVNSSNSCHATASLSLALFVFRVGADDSDHSVPLHNLALFTAYFR